MLKYRSCGCAAVQTKFEWSDGARWSEGGGTYGKKKYGLKERPTFAGLLQARACRVSGVEKR